MNHSVLSRLWNLEEGTDSELRTTSDTIFIFRLVLEIVCRIKEVLDVLLPENRRLHRVKIFVLSSVVVNHEAMFENGYLNLRSSNNCSSLINTYRIDIIKF